MCSSIQDDEIIYVAFLRRLMIKDYENATKLLRVYIDDHKYACNLMIWMKYK